MPKLVELHTSSDDSCQQIWFDLQHNHGLLAAKRIDAEDGRRELDEDKTILVECAEEIRKRCIVVQSRTSDQLDMAELMKATHGFMKAQERLEPKEKRYNKDVAEIIQLEGKCSELASRAFGDASQRLFAELQRYVQALPAHGFDDAVKEDRDMTVTDITDRYAEWDPPNNPLTELLERLNSIESQMLLLQRPDNAGSGRPKSTQSIDPETRVTVSGKAIAGRSENVQHSLSALSRDWNDVSTQMQDFPLVERPPQDDEVPAPPTKRTSVEKKRLKLEMLHHREIPLIPKSLSVKAKALVGALHCQTQQVIKIVPKDIQRIRSDTVNEPEPLSERLNLRHGDDDADRWLPEVPMGRQALERWLFDQLLGSEENLRIYARFLSQEPIVFAMNHSKLRKLIQDKWQIDDTQEPRISPSALLETTQQRSKQAQPDTEHLSVNIEPLGEPLVLDPD